MASQPESHLHSFLYRLTRRSLLSTAEQREILNLPSKIVAAAPNTDFVRSGEMAGQACVVLEGLVGRFQQANNGGRQIIALHIPGDMPDLQTVVQPKAGAALQALTSSTVATIPHVALRNAAAAFPGIAEALWRDCAVDAAILAEWVVNLGRRDGKTRLAHLMCELACRYGVAPIAGQVRFGLPMTQIQLADATGLTPVHVNRILRGLRAQGLTLRYQTVNIADWKTFAELAEFDDGYLQTESIPDNRLRMAG